MPAKRQNAGPSTNQKRTRFASPSASPSIEPDDNLLEEDLPENAGRKKARSRKHVKDTDGYGSDSSNDEEGVVPSRRKDDKEDIDDEDVDMFGDDLPEEPADKGKGKGKGKEKEFMDLEEIEGQEFERGGSALNGEDDESRRKQGLDGDMGIEITPFNMKTEMDEGRFTADGEAYVENERDPNEKHDVWLDSIDEEEISKARRAHLEREKVEREREEKEEEAGAAKDKENDLMRAAVELMERGETVLEALQRLGKEVEDKRKKEEAGQKKKSWAERQKERKAVAEAEAKQANDSYHTSNPFTNLSNIVSALTAIGHLDVYSLSRESLQRMLPAQAPTTNGSSSSSAQAPPRDDRQFQYRFSLAYVRALPEAQRPVEREIFGPFPIAQLRQWRGTGFFGGPQCENVELRIAGEEGASWGSWTDVVEQ